MGLTAAGLVAAAAMVLIVPAGATYAAPGGGTEYQAINPVRAFDSRTGYGALGENSMVTVNLSAVLPADATAVVLNVTGVTPTKGTFLTVWPTGSATPGSSNVNLEPGEIRPNAVTVRVGTGSSVNILNRWGAAHVVVDVFGYYVPDGGQLYNPVSPARVLDTRDGTGTGVAARVGQQTALTLDLSGRVPATATAVTLNLTGVNASTGTFVTAYPFDAPKPNASSLNVNPGAVIPNLVTVPLGPGRRISLANGWGEIDLVADLAGYYDSSGLGFFSLAPRRVLDTRVDPAGSLGEKEGGTLDLSSDLPADARAVVGNLTGTEPTMGTFVAAFPDEQNLPNASNLNLVPSQTAPNLITVATGPSRWLNFYNAWGSSHVIFDLAGYFA
jgi:hypothetical protein